MIQQDISERVVQALAAEHISSQTVSVDGRDVLLTGPAKSIQVSEATQKIVSDIYGVRTVSVHTLDAQPDASTVSAPAPPAQTVSQSKIDSLLEQDVVEFSPGSADLTTHGKEVLDQVAPVLLGSPALNCEIQGHTDSQGDPAANKDLSTGGRLQPKII